MSPGKVPDFQLQAGTITESASRNQNAFHGPEYPYVASGPAAGHPEYIMPDADNILQGLATITAEWPVLAILWHVYFGAIAVALIAGWRPERRDLGLYLVLPLISVSLLAWVHWNPFNGTAAAAMGLVLLVSSMLLGRERVAIGPIWMLIPGILLFAFGWGYPHFLAAEAWWPYLFRAPTGLIPCPTLAILMGLSMACGSFGSRAWAWILGLAGLIYGVFGAYYLGVQIDWILAAGAFLLILTTHVFTALADLPASRGASLPSS